MEHFIASRVADSRYRSRRVDAFASLVSEERAWYESSLKRERHTFAMAEGDGAKKDKATSEPKKKKKKKALTDGETSDGSDSGVCWSDYERTPGTKEGAKGSCRPRGSKKKA
tara:strand:+ start:809 stop:1144 length:336 start_codon:yes stop_codon:yes gene_type:complete